MSHRYRIHLRKSTALFSKTGVVTSDQKQDSALELEDLVLRLKDFASSNKYSEGTQILEQLAPKADSAQFFHAALEYFLQIRSFSEVEKYLELMNQKNIYRTSTFLGSLLKYYQLTEQTGMALQVADEIVREHSRCSASTFIRTSKLYLQEHQYEKLLGFWAKTEGNIEKTFGYVPNEETLLHLFTPALLAMKVLKMWKEITQTVQSFFDLKGKADEAILSLLYEALLELKEFSSAETVYAEAREKKLINSSMVAICLKNLNRELQFERAEQFISDILTLDIDLQGPALTQIIVVYLQRERQFEAEKVYKLFREKQVSDGLDRLDSIFINHYTKTFQREKAYRVALRKLRSGPPFSSMDLKLLLQLTTNNRKPSIAARLFECFIRDGREDNGQYNATYFLLMVRMYQKLWQATEADEILQLMMKLSAEDALQWPDGKRKISRLLQDNERLKAKVIQRNAKFALRGQKPSPIHTLKPPKPTPKPTSNTVVVPPPKK